MEPERSDAVKSWELDRDTIYRDMEETQTVDTNAWRIGKPKYRSVRPCLTRGGYQVSDNTGDIIPEGEVEEECHGSTE
jgi:hypothetical protein